MICLSFLTFCSFIRFWQNIFNLLLFISLGKLGEIILDYLLLILLGYLICTWGKIAIFWPLKLWIACIHHLIEHSLRPIVLTVSICSSLRILFVEKRCWIMHHLLFWAYIFAQIKLDLRLRHLSLLIINILFNNYAIFFSSLLCWDKFNWLIWFKLFLGQNLLNERIWLVYSTLNALFFLFGGICLRFLIQFLLNVWFCQFVSNLFRNVGF